MNKVWLIGRLTRDPEVRYANGKESMCIARFVLAVDRSRKNADGQREADFISCTAFGKLGELIEKYCKKGMKIAAGGRIQTGSYTNKDGARVYTTEVILDEMEFTENRASQGAASGNGAQGGQNGAQGGQNGATGSGNEGFMDIPDDVTDDMLPFR